MDEDRKLPGHFCSLSCLESKKKACCCVVVNKSHLAQCLFLSEGQSQQCQPSYRSAEHAAEEQLMPQLPFLPGQQAPRQTFGMCHLGSRVHFCMALVCTAHMLHLWLSVPCKPRKRIGINHDTANSGLAEESLDSGGALANLVGLSPAGLVILPRRPVLILGRCSSLSGTCLKVSNCHEGNLEVGKGNSFFLLFASFLQGSVSVTGSSLDVVRLQTD